MKDSLLDKRSIGLFAAYIFDKNNFILAYIVILLAGNELKDKKVFSLIILIIE